MTPRFESPVLCSPPLGHPGLQLLCLGPDDGILLAEADGRAADPPPQDDHRAQVLRQHGLQPPHAHSQGGLLSNSYTGKRIHAMRRNYCALRHPVTP
jgi:hypothetical protein